MNEIPSDSGEITRALDALRGDSDGAMDELMSLVYSDLLRMAHRQLVLEAHGHTFNTTDLVHEAYLRLSEQKRVQWANRGHFFAVSAQIMRRVLISHARRHHALRRGGPNKRAVRIEDWNSTDVPLSAASGSTEFLLEIDDALARLAALDARQAQVIECRFFGGLTESETAEALGVTDRTVARDWVKARGWLYRELFDNEE